MDKAAVKPIANFYPRPPRGGRPTSSHFKYGLFDFYPRPPRGGRHDYEGDQLQVKIISIHALREEGDTRGTLKSCTSCYFYPRPPRGGRQDSKLACTELTVFLSTPSARRATNKSEGIFQYIGFLSTPSARRATNRRRS